MFCHECGNKLAKGTGFCINCGTSIPYSAHIPEQKTSHVPKQNLSQVTTSDTISAKPKIKMLFGIIVVAVVALVLIIGSALFLLRPSTEMVPDFSDAGKDQIIELMPVEAPGFTDLRKGEERTTVPDLVEIDEDDASLDPMPPATSLFDLDVWGEENSISLIHDGVTVQVPIPPWLDHDDLEFYQDHHVYIIDRINDQLMTMVEVHLITLNDTIDFQQQAEAEIIWIVEFLGELLDYNHDAFTIFVVEGDNSLTAGIRILEYVEEGSSETIELLEIIRIVEYNGIMIRTRLRLRTVDAPDTMCSLEFADAFYLWGYIEEDYIQLDP